MNCPRCQAAMQEVPLDGHLGRSVTIDLCHPCQSFWFDTRESLQLTPGSTLKLFRLIGEHKSTGTPADGQAQCPRCHSRMRLSRDMQRNTRFEYLSCPAGHGRLTTFFNFLREKDFVRPLSAAQIAHLRESLDTLNCSNCGAPIDLAKASACGHCGSPLSMLDLAQAESLIAQLQKAERSAATVDPAMPLRLEQARRQVQAGFDAFELDDTWMRDVSASGLVGAGLQALTRWLK
jgi:hypothetical protein